MVRVRCGCGECVVHVVQSSTGDVFVRGVGGVCDMCVFGSGRCGWSG